MLCSSFGELLLSMATYCVKTDCNSGHNHFTSNSPSFDVAMGAIIGRQDA